MAIKDAEKAPPPQPPRIHRFRERIRRNRLLNTAWRLGVLLVGSTVLLAGLIMMVTPGPGILGIILGLAILATEFTWAQRALHRARAAADRAKDKALDPRKRRRNLILGTLATALGIAAAVAYLVIYGFVVPWQIDDLTFWT
ncbi:hypothetical protein GCM10022254_16860 [Actinomadura meridiana]|uniref:TIGR02611 family protein n=1 Tax=Actinomadura meridiana TaxID=559626 RepID=A0ABP8BW72_9ACTN